MTNDGESWFPDLRDPQTRRFVLLVGLGLLGVLLLLSGNLWTGTDVRQDSETRPAQSSTEKGTAYPTSAAETEIAALQVALEQELQDILSEIRGVGAVEVRITLAGGTEVSYERDETVTAKTTEEHDSEGGTRVITEETHSGELVLVRVQASGGEKPLIRHVVRPEVDGVLVVAAGAGDSRIKAVITGAVETLLQLQPHQVEVLPMKGGN